MKALDIHRRAWPLIGLCLALLFTLGSGVAEAQKDKGGGKCEGTKKQRKQKMEKREFSDEQFEEMIAQYKKEVSAELEVMKQTVIRRLEREYGASRTTDEPFVYDILIISGGGAKGAFGAGFFEGWGEIESGPYARPVFDMVTGVSTGALISPFAYLGTDEAYAEAAEFYANPAPNWVTKRGTIKFLPSHISMFNTCHLQDTVRSAIDSSMIEDLAEVTAEDRLLLIGTTNLDIGVGRAFNLGQEARQMLENPGSNRVARILLASSAIPGAFPPLEIDGMLYADGGSTSNLFIATFPGPEGAMAGFKANNPEAPLQKVRVWILVNQQLKPQHHVTQPKWIEISGRALGTLTSTTQLFALAIIRDMVDDAKAERGIDAELHLVSIPDDAPKKTTKEMFDQKYMRALQDLGRKMGADPSSWTNAIPSAYRVREKWLESR
jgi:predicted acylesterase/phospholipase RssA